MGGIRSRYIVPGLLGAIAVAAILLAASGAITALGGDDQGLWGDLDCDGDITTRDNQALLREVLGQTQLSQTEPCADIGSTVVFVGASPPPAPTNSPAHTATPTPHATPTPGGTTTVTPAPSVTPTPALTPTPTLTPSPGPTQSPPPSGTATATITPPSSPTPTPTPTPVPTASPTPPPTASPTPGPLNRSCWLAVVSHGIVWGFASGETCTPSNGPVYVCTVSGDTTTCDGTATGGGEYDCANIPPSQSWSCPDSTTSYPNYTCSRINSMIYCNTSASGWPDFRCSAASDASIPCETQNGVDTDFTCNRSGLAYACN